MAKLRFITRIGTRTRAGTRIIRDSEFSQKNADDDENYKQFHFVYSFLQSTPLKFEKNDAFSPKILPLYIIFEHSKYTLHAHATHSHSYNPHIYTLPYDR